MSVDASCTHDLVYSQLKIVHVFAIDMLPVDTFQMRQILRDVNESKIEVTKKMQFIMYIKQKRTWN